MAFSELEIARHQKVFAAFKEKYGPGPEVGTLEKFFQIVHEDAEYCFFG